MKKKTIKKSLRTSHMWAATTMYLNVGDLILIFFYAIYESRCANDDFDKFNLLVVHQKNNLQMSMNSVVVFGFMTH